MTSKFLSDTQLSTLIADLLAAETRVIAPARSQEAQKQLDYLPIQSPAEAQLGISLTRRSLKEFFLPPTEVLFSYKQTKSGVELTEVPTKARPQVIFGASPCDAAALEVVDKVMNWEYHDELWFGRREATTIVSLLCSVMDSSCFCTAVGVGPDSARGSDVLLTPVGGGYLAQVVTEKGEALLAGYGNTDLSAPTEAEAEAKRHEARGKVENNAPAVPDEFSAWLARNFDNALWKTIALRCHGCGACASLCPTCHCFDIVDEHDSSEQGVRRRNWDSCQTSKFTLHSSGHNPRQSQSERFRQRIQHKFSIYPSRFGEILCTGCGRCSRVCSGGMNLPEIVGELVALAKTDAEGSAQ